MPLLDGKKGLILNIANDRSIGAHIGNNAARHGATLGFGYLPMDNKEKSERRARKALDEYGIKATLPLNKPVTVNFTPKKAGELKYGCAMNKMIGGVLSVQ